MMAYSVRVYSLFLNETLNHLKWVREQAEDYGLKDTSLRDQAKQRLHKIKGGAGFFSLTEIEQLSADLEEALASPGAACCPAVLNAIDQCISIITRLNDVLRDQQKEA